MDAEIIYVKGCRTHKNRSVIPCLHYRKDSAEIWQQLPLVWETLCVCIISLGLTIDILLCIMVQNVALHNMPIHSKPSQVLSSSPRFLIYIFVEG